MSTVHVVSGFYDYEGGRVICAYATKAGAEAFVARCKAHEDRKPEPTPDGCTEAESDAWWAKHQKWDKLHPAGQGNTMFDGYVVNSMRLRATQADAAGAGQEAAAVQAVGAMSDQQIWDWWASENGLENCNMCRLEDFRKMVRAVEARLAALCPPVGGGDKGAIEEERPSLTMSMFANRRDFEAAGGKRDDAP